MALNAIKAPLVYYPNKGNSITVDGTVVDFGSQKFEYVTTTLAKEQRISRDTLTNSKEYTVELGEKYLLKLESKTTNDDFDRPSYTWGDRHLSGRHQPGGRVHRQGHRPGSV